MDMSFTPGGAFPAGPFVAGENGEGALQAAEAIDVAGTMFRELAEDLHRLRVTLRDGGVEDVKDTARLVRDLRAATQLVLEERNRVDKLGARCGHGCRSTRTVAGSRTSSCPAGR